MEGWVDLDNRPHTEMGNTHPHRRSAIQVLTQQPVDHKSDALTTTLPRHTPCMNPLWIRNCRQALGRLAGSQEMLLHQAACRLPSWKSWHHVRSPFPSIDAYLLEEQFYQILSGSLCLFWCSVLRELSWLRCLLPNKRYSSVTPCQVICTAPGQN